MSLLGSATGSRRYAVLAVTLLTDLARRTLTEQRWRKIGLCRWTGLRNVSRTVESGGHHRSLHAQRAGGCSASLADVAVAEVAIIGGRAWLWLTSAGLVLGLGLGNHLTLALMVPGLIVVMCPLRQAVLRQGRWHTRVLPLAAFALGLATYVYLPWAASRISPVNWGDASTPVGFRG